MSKLLQEALADAKAVKRIAIENAKVALEETFQREVTGMFQEKIKEELANEETYGVGDQSGGLQGSSDIGGTVGGSKKPSAKAHKTSTKVSKLETGVKLDEEAEDSMHAEVGSHDNQMEASEEAVHDETITNEELEEILSSLEEELDEEGEPSPAQPPVDPMAQTPAPAPAPMAPAPVDPNAPVAAQPPVDPNAPVAPVAPAPMAQAQPPVAEEEESMEEISLDELLSEIGAEESLEEAKEEDDDEKEEKEEGKEEDEDLKEQNTSLRTQLSEHIKVIEYLREQINEINLLNAKLLYTNKLFKQFGLSNTQKLSIVEKFDLASTVREVKYAYTILAESLSSGASTVKKTNTVAKSITEGLASKAVASTKPSKDVIVENTNEMALKFQRLAGIKK
jgi:hypothetical protein